ncbi:hypothetical protein FRC12_010803 [Ceratobasidium sp. 428]|nr:hypothetical protein FRC12_010803 [Ceratobasidium sp. 428]
MSRVSPHSSRARPSRNSTLRLFSATPSSVCIPLFSLIPGSHNPGHDLLFGPGPQFRPTSDCKRRELIEKHLQAVPIEVDTRFVCTSFEERGRRLPCVCRSLASSSFRLPLSFRIPTLANELRQALHSVVHSTTANATLIAQELRHGVFDSRGVLRTLASCTHARPCGRDDGYRRSETRRRSPRRPIVSRDPRAHEILELMKLDIANHQLQALRPYLFETAVEFELKTFQNRHERGLLTLTTTEAWLRKAALTAPSTSTLPLLSHALTGPIFSPSTNVSTPPPPTTTLCASAYPTSSLHRVIRRHSISTTPGSQV